MSVRSKKRSAANSRPPEAFVFFIDRSLGRHDVANALRNAGRRVVIHDDEFSQDAPDVEWLERAGREGWVVLTRDDMIRRRENEKQAMIAAGARAFVLTGGNLAGIDMAAAFVKALPRMERLARKQRPPFIATVTRTGGVALVWPSATR